MRLAVLAILVGLLASLSVALYIAAYGNIHSLQGQYGRPVEDHPLPSWVRDDWPAPSQVRFMPGRSWGFHYAGTDCLVEGTLQDEPPRMVTVWSNEFGWPRRCVRWLEAGAFQDCDKRSARAAAALRVFNERVSWRAGMPFPAWTKIGGPMDRRVIPTAPIWGGLAADTLFYGIPAWLLLAGPGLVRRSIRQRSGQCEACGYPIGTASTCSECGRAVRPREAVAA